MSEAPAVEPQGTPAAPTTTAPKPAPAAPAQETDWKAEARKWEDRAKENSKAATKLAEIEAANLTEAQRLTARAETAEKALAERETEALRLRIASKHGITGDYVDLVQGADEAAIEAAATKVASLITKEPERKGAVGPYVPPEGGAPNTPLNGDPLLQALKDKLGIA